MDVGSFKMSMKRISLGGFVVQICNVSFLWIKPCNFDTVILVVTEWSKIKNWGWIVMLGVIGLIEGIMIGKRKIAMVMVWFSFLVRHISLILGWVIFLWFSFMLFVWVSRREIVGCLF
jgi:hypothetical protein